MYNIYTSGKSLPIATAYTKEKADKIFEEVCNKPQKYGVEWEAYMLAFPSGEVIKREIVATWEERMKMLELYS